MKDKRLEIDAKALEQAAATLASIPRGFETAFVRATNRALRKGRTDVVKSIRTYYTVKARDARSAFKIIRPTTKDLSRGELRLSGKRPRLNAFTFKPKTNTTGAARKDVMLQAKKKESAKRIGDSFVYNGRILTRLGDASARNMYGPLVEYTGASVPEMANNPNVVSDALEAMHETFVKRLDHEVDFILSEKGRKTVGAERKWK